MTEFKQYKRKNVSEMRTYVEGENLSNVSISDADVKNGSKLIKMVNCRRRLLLATHPSNLVAQLLLLLSRFSSLPKY